ncbi:MAG TPA: LysM peptidoglycan-binding domain-containing protein [Actinomycetota bacterium]|nr:LysM peptidoglycan-binding domain-containing protein [Actinomycetota bacterium]
MARTYVRHVGRAVAVAALCAAAVLAAGRAAGGAGQAPASVPSLERHVVRAGETLWDIARARVGPEGDPRPLVEAIRRANGVRPGELVPGLELAVPAAPGP